MVRKALRQRELKPWHEGYSRELIDGIVDSYLKEDGTLKRAALENNIGHATLIRWLADNRDGFKDKFEEARAYKILMLSEELIRLSDEAESCESSKDLTALKLRIDTRKWMIERLLPEFRTGKSGGGGDMVVNTSVVLLPDNGRGDTGRVIDHKELKESPKLEAPVNADWWEEENK